MDEYVWAACGYNSVNEIDYLLAEPNYPQLSRFEV